MVTWLPAAVSINERISCRIFKCCLRTVQRLSSKCNHLGNYLEEMFITAVVRLPYLWIILFAFIGILGGIIVLYWPKFRLPDSPDFQLFSSDHPFEVYDSKFKNKFWFEKLYTVSLGQIFRFHFILIEQLIYF